MDYYFAYGSNMDIKQMEKRIGIGNFRFLGVFDLENHCLKFNKKSKKKHNIGFANIERCDGSKVVGYLYEMKDIKDMDRFEGYPSQYRREMMAVSNGKINVKCYVYIANEDVLSDGLNIEKTYFDKIMNANLDKSYLDGIKMMYEDLII